MAKSLWWYNVFIYCNSCDSPQQTVRELSKSKLDTLQCILNHRAILNNTIHSNPPLICLYLLVTFT